MAEWISQNWERVLTVSGFLVGLFGLLGIVIGWKSWKVKKPIYVINNNNIFSNLNDKVPDVKVCFSGYGDEIKSLTVSKIYFWNAGNETVQKQDMVKGDPLRVRIFYDAVLLSASIIKCNNPLNKFSIKINRDRTELAIEFDYFDHLEGLVVQIFHTGVFQDSLRVVGTFKGINTTQYQITSDLKLQTSIRKMNQKTASFASYLKAFTGLMQIVTIIASVFTIIIIGGIANYFSIVCVYPFLLLVLFSHAMDLYKWFTSGASVPKSLLLFETAK